MNPGLLSTRRGLFLLGKAWIKVFREEGRISSFSTTHNRPEQLPVV